MQHIHAIAQNPTVLSCTILVQQNLTLHTKNLFYSSASAFNLALMVVATVGMPLDELLHHSLKKNW